MDNMGTLTRISRSLGMAHTRSDRRHGRGRRGDSGHRGKAAGGIRRSRGQSIIIFALTFTVLLGFAGLAVDVARGYDLYARMQRAADSAAAAGVLYLPNNYNAPLADGVCNCSAITRAQQEAAKNGFDATDVVVSTVPNKPTDLQVTINQTMNLALLTALGMAPIHLAATAQAEYLSPFPVGLDNTPNFFGDEGECNVTGGSPVNCNPGGSGAHVQNFMANIEGPASLKEQGDPYVLCEEGPSTTNVADQGTNVANGQYTLQTYTGMSTNHAQYPDTTPTLTAPNPTVFPNRCGPPVTGGAPGNPDQQPAGYDGPMTHNTGHPGAYNYAIVIPQSQQGGGVWIYNAPFVPFISSGNSCPGRQPVDTFRKNHDCTTWEPKFGMTGTFNGAATPISFNGNFDDPYFYFNVTYTLYSVSAPYFRALDVPVWQLSAAIHQNAPFGDPTTGASVPQRPYDQMTQDLQLHGCQTNGSVVYDLSGHSSYSGQPITAGQGCVAPPQCFAQWCKLAEGLQAGLYRLAVEVTGYNPSNAFAAEFTHGLGKHNYGVKVCAQGTTNGVGCQSGGSVSAWNNMDITMNFPSANAQNVFPLADIPAQFGGRTINVSFFDPGDSDPGNDSWFTVVPPATNETGTLANPTIPMNYGQDCQNPPQPSPTWVRTDIMPTVSGGIANGQPAIRTSANGDNIYNGLWITTCIQLPPNYVGGLWKMDIYSSHGTNTDTVSISFMLVGSPVHLVTP